MLDDCAVGRTKSAQTSGVKPICVRPAIGAFPLGPVRVAPLVAYALSWAQYGRHAARPLGECPVGLALVIERVRDLAEAPDVSIPCVHVRTVGRPIASRAQRRLSVQLICRTACGRRSLAGRQAGSTPNPPRNCPAEQGLDQLASNLCG